MAQLSGEALLISALINVGDIQEGQHYGLSVGDFRGYKDEYNWLLNYVSTGHFLCSVPRVPLLRARGRTVRL
jgi:hypothetical protein